MKKSEKDIKAQREQHENDIMRRVLYWLGAAVILEAFVLISNRYLFHYLIKEIDFAASLWSVIGVLQYAGFIVGIALIAWGVFAKKKDERRGVFRVILGSFFAMIGLCSLLFMQFNSASVSILLVMIPAAAGLVLIYYLYQREFFAVAFLSGIGILGLWLIRSGNTGYQTMYYVYTGLTLCLVALILFFSVKLKKENGRWKRGDGWIAILKPDANYSMLWATAAIVAGTLLLALALGAGFAYYAVLAMVVWLLVMAVYFTSRLM